MYSRVSRLFLRLSPASSGPMLARQQHARLNTRDTSKQRARTDAQSILQLPIRKWTQEQWDTARAIQSYRVGKTNQARISFRGKVLWPGHAPCPFLFCSIFLPYIPEQKSTFFSSLPSLYSLIEAPARVWRREGERDPNAGQSVVGFIGGRK